MSYGLWGDSAPTGIIIYDPKFNAYDREQCAICGQWVPWPAMDDHAECVEDAIPSGFVDSRGVQY